MWTRKPMGNRPGSGREKGLGSAPGICTGCWIRAKSIRALPITPRSRLPFFDPSDSLACPTRPGPPSLMVRSPRGAGARAARRAEAASPGPGRKTRRKADRPSRRMGRRRADPRQKPLRRRHRRRSPPQTGRQESQAARKAVEDGEVPAKRDVRAPRRTGAACPGAAAGAPQAGLLRSARHVQRRSRAAAPRLSRRRHAARESSSAP